MKDQNGHFLISGDNKKFIAALTVEYKILGTIPVDELLQAIYADLHALKDIHNVQFITGARLRLPVTDGYGQPLTVRRADGSAMHQMHTYHHKPAYKNYDL